MKLVGGTPGQQGHVPAAGHDVAHLGSLRVPLQHRGALVILGHELLPELHETNFDFPIHYDGCLIMRGRIPGRGSFRANRLQHVLEILAYRDLFVGFRSRGDFEDIRKGVVARIVIDNLYPTLFVILERSEPGPAPHHSSILPEISGVRPRGSRSVPAVARAWVCASSLS